MTTLEIILVIAIICIIVDVYNHLRYLRRMTNLWLFHNSIINKILSLKNIVTAEEINFVKKDILNKMNTEDFKKLKKELLKVGVDIEKESTSYSLYSSFDKIIWDAFKKAEEQKKKMKM